MEVGACAVIVTVRVNAALRVVAPESSVDESASCVDFDTTAIAADDVVDARVDVGSTKNHLSHLLTVSECDTDWNRQLLSNFDRYTDFVDPQVWVRRNDRARTEVDTLSREVRSESPFFAFQSLC